MKPKRLKKTSVFPAPENEVFEKLKALQTLQRVAYPYATFEPEPQREALVWEKGQTFQFQFKLFGQIPLGIHTIHVIEFDTHSHTVYTHEGNIHVPVWNHKITLQAVSQTSVSYTDEVELYAGWKTPFVYLWAKAFYSHRQKNWIRLLKSGGI